MLQLRRHWYWYWCWWSGEQHGILLWVYTILLWNLIKLHFQIKTWAAMGQYFPNCVVRNSLNLDPNQEKTIRICSAYLTFINSFFIQNRISLICVIFYLKKLLVYYYFGNFVSRWAHLTASTDCDPIKKEGNVLMQLLIKIIKLINMNEWKRRRRVRGRISIVYLELRISIEFWNGAQNSRFWVEQIFIWILRT